MTSRPGSRLPPCFCPLSRGSCPPEISSGSGSLPLVELLGGLGVMYGSGVTSRPLTLRVFSILQRDRCQFLHSPAARCPHCPRSLGPGRGGSHSARPALPCAPGRREPLRVSARASLPALLAPGPGQPWAPAPSQALSLLSAAPCGGPGICMLRVNGVGKIPLRPLARTPTASGY